MRERERRAAQISTGPLFDKARRPLTPERWEFWLSKCHAKQRAFLLDRNKFKALLCPRQTGKTTVSLFESQVIGEERPGSTLFYIVPDSKDHARRLFWRPLQRMNDELKLGLKFYEADKRVVLPNETQILLFGAHDKNASIQLRGDAVSGAILDECKDFGPHFEEVVVEAVVPSLTSYEGSLVLEGTPGSVLAGLFYETTKDPEHPPPGWTVHKWIKSDNTTLPEKERDIEHVVRTSYLPFGHDINSPKVRREVFAEWCTDETERVYLYDSKRNGWDGTLPPGHDWMYCMGVDFGERDANAFVVGAFATTHRHMYIVDEYARPRMSIDEIAAKINEFRAKYPNFVSIVGDSGGYGRGIVTDLQDRHGIPIEPADKGKNKLGNISLMNSDFLSGRIRARDNTPLTLEWKKLTKRIRPTDLKVLLDHTDLGDAALYMWKASVHWASIEPVSEPQPGTKEHWQKLESNAILNASRNRAKPWYGAALSDEN